MKNVKNTEIQNDDIGEAENAQISQNISVVGGEGQKRCRSGYLTTKEAADYLRKSVSWVVKRHDIPYVKGTPNIYKQKDLDDWFERNKFNPVRI